MDMRVHLIMDHGIIVPNKLDDDIDGVLRHCRVKHGVRVDILV